MLQTQPMLLDLQKLLVKRKDFGWASGTRRRKTACGVRQNLLQMTGRFHRQFGLLFNLKLDLKNPNRSQTEKKQSVSDDCFRPRSEEHTSELQSPCNLVCRLLLEQ